MIVDAQVHIWEADRPDRPWPAGQAGRAHRDVPLSADELLAEMAEAGVDRAMLVPPSYEGDWNDLVLDAARTYPERFAAMGRITVDDPAARALLPRWRDQPGMLGIRLTFHLGRQRDWLRNGAAEWLWPAAEAAGVPLMVLPTGSLPLIGAAAQRHPGLRIIIDHFSLHRAKGEPPGVDQNEIAELIALARFPNVGVKASALPLFSAEPYPHRDLHDVIHAVFDAYGPKRMFWGSDMTRLPCTYRQSVTLFTEELGWLNGADRDDVMGRSLCSWLGWHTAPIRI